MNLPVLLAASINWHSFFFLLFALVACGMAIAVLVSANIVRMAFYLTISLGAVAGLFMLAGAHFVGAMQLLIYVGGTLVLLIFGVMLTAQAQFIEMKTRGGEWVLAAIVGGSLLAVLIAAATSVPSWQSPDQKFADAAAKLDVNADTTAIGNAFVGARVDSLAQPNEQLRRGMSGYFLPFEIVSMHLLVVLIGAAYLARARVSTSGAPARRRAAAQPRRRNALATAVLVLAFAAHCGCAAICFLPGATFKTQIYGMATVQSWFWPALGTTCAIAALLTLVILNWQKWGYYALVVLAVIEIYMLHRAEAPLLIIGGAGLISLVWLVILYSVLQIGGERSHWAQSE
jgi:NADH-quinone oxidoreductase subunit J